MKQIRLIIAFLAFTPAMLAAQPVDIIGGRDDSTQTIHHCGFLKPSSTNYTNSPVLVRIIERHLRALGYLKAESDGIYGKAVRAAVKKFQNDYGLPASGIVDGATAQHLAFVSHPSAHVHSCFRFNQ